MPVAERVFLCESWHVCRVNGCGLNGKKVKLVVAGARCGHGGPGRETNLLSSVLSVYFFFPDKINDKIKDGVMM